MKTSFLKYAIAVIGLLALSCENSNDDNMLNNLSPAQITELNGIATNGDWIIAYYFDTDKEETNDFSGYTFRFHTDGSIEASDGVNTINGTWSITNSDDSNDDSPDEDSDVDFNISFASPANFTDLSDDWDIVDFTSTRIELVDISGGNGGTDNLIFVKN